MIVLLMRDVWIAPSGEGALVGKGKSIRDARDEETGKRFRFVRELGSFRADFHGLMCRVS